MARRSLRVSEVAAVRSSSKRPAGSEKAGKSKKARVQTVVDRTKQAEPDETGESSESEPDDASGYEESAADDDEDEESEIEEVSSEDEATPKRRSNGAVKQRSSQKSSGKKSHDIAKPGTKTGLGPGTQVIIKKPRARSPGKTPYTDETIHPNTMLFLQDLAKNNDRQWLKLNDPDYRASWKDFETFLDALTQGITTVDETVPELPLKDIIFRIYRDVRFSKDQTPYKTAFSAAWSRTGRKGPYAVYYLQIKPNGGSMIAGGLWMPEAAALSALRRNIDRRPQQIKAALSSAGIRKEFLGGVSKDEEKIIKRFVSEHADTSLKTRPKGFEADHKDIALLRLKNFTLHRKLKDSEVTSPNAVETIVGLIAHLVPFVTYLNNVVQPDEPPEDDEEEEDSSDDGDEERD